MNGFRSAYSLLESSQVRRAESVSLRNDGDQVDTRAEALHNLNIKGLQGVAGGSDEVQTGVDTEIDLVCTARLLLLQHV